MHTSWWLQRSIWLICGASIYVPAQNDIICSVCLSFINREIFQSEHFFIYYLATLSGVFMERIYADTISLSAYLTRSDNVVFDLSNNDTFISKLVVVDTEFSQNYFCRLVVHRAIARSPEEGRYMDLIHSRFFLNQNRDVIGMLVGMPCESSRL